MSDHATDITTPLVTIACLSDNYAFLLFDGQSGRCLLVDAPEAAPILAEVQRRGWPITDIFLTHHHDDHVQGLGGILARFPQARVWGARADAHRLPPLTDAVAAGDVIEIGALTGTVIDVSGHTIGHIALHLPAARVAFTGDSLMAMGCGRLFEGSADQMWNSLSKLAALPPDTRIASGHEYTQSNARFALSVDQGNPALAARVAQITAARARGQATVPSLLADELATNPFLRAPHLKAALGMDQASDAQVFAEIRARKDRF